MFRVFLQTQKFSGKALPPPDSDDEHISVADNDGNLVGVIVQSKRARLAAEKLKKK